MPGMWRGRSACRGDAEDLVCALDPARITAAEADVCSRAAGAGHTRTSPTLSPRSSAWCSPAAVPLGRGRVAARVMQARDEALRLLLADGGDAIAGGVEPTVGGPAPGGMPPGSSAGRRSCRCPQGGLAVDLAEPAEQPGQVRVRGVRQVG